jgi:hypothetical protein
MKRSIKTKRSRLVIKNAPSKEGRQAEKALKMAVAGVVEEHMRLGLPIAVMRGDKAVYVNAEDQVTQVREPKTSFGGKAKFLKAMGRVEKSEPEPKDKLR